MDYYTRLTGTFSNKNAAMKAMNVAKAVLADNGNTYDRNYARTPSQFMSDELEVKKNKLILSGYCGFYVPEDTEAVLTDIFKEIAKTMPTETFTFESYTDSTYSDIDIEGNYINGTLTINSIYYPCGYVEYLRCPECCEEILSLEEYDPEKKQYVCPECGETIDLAKVFEDMNPVKASHIFTINK